ncbi:class II aldolase/adducin family protein [Peptococcus simiae]|uniref:class II aldolase/adducin family protein n=1 Tax=Peptococcus simiae TaxID=1643805 RepID=UPI00397F3E87
MVNWAAEDDLIRACHLLAETGLVTATDGNLSKRTDQGLMITPTGRAKALLQGKDLCYLDANGEILEGPGPSREWAFHRAIYMAKPEVLAICHAHPDFVTALASQDLARHERFLFDAELRFPQLGYIEKITPGSADLARAVAKASLSANALLLASHGAITWGQSAMEAVQEMAALERWARTVFILQRTGI